MSHHDFSLRDVQASAPFFALKTSRHGTRFLWALAIVLAVTAGWTVFASIDEWARGHAILRPAGEIVEVRNERAGRVHRRPVSHGEEVEAGDLLWEIDTGVVEAELESLESRLGSLHEEQRELELVLASLESGAVPPGNPDSFAHWRAEALLLEQSRLEVEREAVRRRWERARDRPESAQRGAELEELRSDYEAADLGARRFLPTGKADIRERLRSIENQLAQIREAEVAARQRLRESRITAPISGRVEFRRDLSAGEYLSAGESPARVVPESAAGFRLLVLVPEREAGEVRVGQELVLRFSAFSVAEYGSLRGRVVYVPMESEDADAERAYEIRGVLEQSYLTDREGTRYPLRPGMTAEARIITRSLPVYRYLLEKLDFIL